MSRNGSDTVRRLKERFRQLDTSKDGRLDFKEMLLLLRKGNPNMSERELQALFDMVDKNGDGKIDFDEFVEFIHAPSGATDTRQQEIIVPDDVPDDVPKMFEAFCGREVGSMDGKAFAKLCKDCGLLDKSFTAQDMDVIFARVKPRGLRNIGLQEFLKALTLVAERKGMDVYVLYAIVGDAEGPVVNATQAESVRFHDDKSTYTGVSAKVAAARQEPDELAGLLERERRRSQRLSVTRLAEQPNSARSRSRAATAPAAPVPPIGRTRSPVRTVVDDDTDWSLVEPTFRAYASGGFLEGPAFLALLKDCRILDPQKFKLSDVDMTFAKVCVRGAEKKIGLEQFQEALKLIAAKKNCAPYFIQAAVAGGRTGLPATGRKGSGAGAGGGRP